jgi:hypothetical protein
MDDDEWSRQLERNQVVGRLVRRDQVLQRAVQLEIALFFTLLSQPNQSRRNGVRYDGPALTSRTLLLDTCIVSGSLLTFSPSCDVQLPLQTVFSSGLTTVILLCIILLSILSAPEPGGCKLVQGPVVTRLALPRSSTSHANHGSSQLAHLARFCTSPIPSRSPSLISLTLYSPSVMSWPAHN